MTNLVQFFSGGFVDALARREAAVLSDLAHRRCIIAADQRERPSVEFELPDLFNVLWRHAAVAGLDLPGQGPWDSDFDQFCEALFSPWPDSDLARHGYAIKLLKGNRGPQRNRYLLTPV